MGFCDVAVAVGADGPKLRFAKACGDINQAVAEDRPGHVGEARNVDPPDFFACERFVSADAISAHADELVLAINGDDQGRVVGFLEFASLRDDLTAVGFPGEFAREFVKRGDVALFGAVAIQDEEVLVKDRGTARGIFVVIMFKLGVRPENFARGTFDAGHAIHAEADIDVAILNDGRGRGVAVEGMFGRGV